MVNYYQGILLKEVLFSSNPTIYGFIFADAGMYGQVLIL